jgi:mannose-1-phosphate guanylyltransferase
MSEINVVPVLLAGGSGTRLWPLSRSLYPKQFLPLVEENTLLQSTIDRLEGLQNKGVNCLDPIVICNEEHRFIVAEQFRQIKKGTQAIILEPVGKNTAPAITLAAIEASKNHNDPILLVLAADHLIKDTDSFQQAVAQAACFADEDELVTFGVEADKPETGYGYIKRGKAHSIGGIAGKANAYCIDCFVEKPDQLTAQQYVESNDYLWNSGMFVFKASRFLEEMAFHRQDIVSVCEESLSKAEEDLEFIRLDAKSFMTCPEDSVDCAVMEKTERALVVPLPAGWSDLGSWSSLWETQPKDDAGNVTHGDVLVHRAEDCYAYSQSRLISLLGTKDLVVVETKDAILVADRNEVQDVKSLVAQLKSQGRDEWKLAREVFRPWGKYDSVDIGGRHQVKRITVKPGAKLSLQMHYHRAEHWIVVSGTAKVTVGDDVVIVSENESTYIPIGIVHSLENPGSIPLELIEVQSGSYLGEDDIVRLEDKYGRK